MFAIKCYYSYLISLVCFQGNKPIAILYKCLHSPVFHDRSLEISKPHTDREIHISQKNEGNYQPESFFIFSVNP